MWPSEDSGFCSGRGELETGYSTLGRALTTTMFGHSGSQTGKSVLEVLTLNKTPRISSKLDMLECRAFAGVCFIGVCQAVQSFQRLCYGGIDVHFLCVLGVFMVLVLGGCLWSFSSLWYIVQSCMESYLSRKVSLGLGGRLHSSCIDLRTRQLYLQLRLTDLSSQTHGSCREEAKYGRKGTEDPSTISHGYPGADPGFWSRGPSGVLTPGGAWAQHLLKIAWKLILKKKKKLLGTRGAAARAPSGFASEFLHHQHFDRCNDSTRKSCPIHLRKQKLPFPALLRSFTK